MNKLIEGMEEIIDIKHLEKKEGKTTTAIHVSTKERVQMILTLINDALPAKLVVDEECPDCDNGRLHRRYENWRCNKCKGIGTRTRKATLDDLMEEPLKVRVVKG